jgi:cytochrome c oxidase subunit 2
MLVEKYEKIFMQISGVFLLAAVVALVFSVTGDHASLPEPAGRLDPDDVRTTEPFDETGVFQTGDDEFQAVMIAQAWAWEPAEVIVPEGAEVTFTVTSADVVHGFWIPETQANAMVIPGQVTEFTMTFDEPGTHSLICHEYCGIGHHNMGGTINVVPADS